VGGLVEGSKMGRRFVFRFFVLYQVVCTGWMDAGCGIFGWIFCWFGMMNFGFFRLSCSPKQ
jgi:hypothetical protein